MVRQSAYTRSLAFVLFTILLSLVVRPWVWGLQTNASQLAVHALNALGIALACLVVFRICQESPKRRYWLVFAVAFVLQWIYWWAMQSRFQTPDVPLLSLVLVSALDPALMAVAATVSALLADRVVESKDAKPYR